MREVTHHSTPTSRMPSTGRARTRLWFVRMIQLTRRCRPANKLDGTHRAPASGRQYGSRPGRRRSSRISGSRPESTLRSFEIKASIAGVDRSKYSLVFRSDDPTVAAASSAGEIPAEKAGKASFAVELEATVKNPKLWTPETPELYPATLELKDEAGKVIDSVETYFGLRTISRGKYGDQPYERILLNGKPIYLRAALDQSFNPKGLYTAPDDDFLKRDMIIAKEMGLNGLRIHIG